MTDQQPKAPQAKESKRLQCPSCGCEHLPVYYTRHIAGRFIRRVRKCRHCGRQIVTSERLVG